MSTMSKRVPVEGSSTHVAAFKQQTHYDPFLPRTQTGEKLVEVRADYNSDRHSPSDDGMGPHGHGPMLMPDEVHQSNALGLVDMHSEAHSEVHSVGHQSSGASFHTSITPQSYTGTSPSNGYSSDFEYPAMNEYATQDFENTFLLEADFGPLPIPDDSQDLSIDSALQASEEPASATSIKSHAISYMSGRSTGLATNSSHLMSPSLTDSASPGSGIELNSPPMRTRLLGGGDMSRMSSQSTGTESANPYGQAVYTRYTPAMTGSSLEVTPEPTIRVGFSETTSPVVRIESYSRGDSPARTAKGIERSGSKRSRGSRSSAHLAAPHDDLSDESDEDTYPGHTRGSHTSADSAIPSRYQDPAEARTGLDPFIRSKVADETVLNFKDQEEKADLAATKAVVTQWLATSVAEVGTALEDPAPIGARRYKAPAHRRRAKSTNDQREIERYANGTDSARRDALSAKIPGPGILLDEDSGNDEEEDEDDVSSRSCIESAPASVDGRIEAAEVHEATSPGFDGELRPHDAHPWVDPFHVRSLEDTPGQPPTSQAAMMRFMRRAADLDAVSRVATWGTTCRRLSETDLEKFIGREGLLSRLSISKDKSKGKDERRGSFLEQAAAKLLPKRSPSNYRRKTSEPTKPMYAHVEENDYGRKDSMHGRKDCLHGRKESLGSRAGSPSVATSLRRIPSINKNSKSPKINTGSAIAAVATHIAALGGNGSISPTAAASPTGAWNSARNALKRTLGGDLHRPPQIETTEPGIADLWNKQGGPPRPTLTSPPEDKEVTGPFGPPTGGEEDAESDEIVDEKGVSMDFTPRNVLIVPTFEGFKINVREINPRLPTYLVDRIGQEQLRRYKKLIEFKVKHAQARQLSNCSSGTHCPDRGGAPTYFPSKANQKELRHSHTGFSTVAEPEMDEDEEAVAEGAVTAAQFPPGVPMPPAKRLPAQFECPLCFTVKRFQKPSDWSKHVHEDLQPFTCTFPTCPDPKSFKRKADWVRHENERHRQLEWWTCTEDGCSHQCYRRDNFVQHLVREHKMPEPKAKTTKPNKPAVRGPAKNKARVNREAENSVAPEDRVLTMIETCRHETQKHPSEEPCRFCNNICNSWKKLTVHLARHMEQISMPVLELVRDKDVSPDTIISPIEQRLPSQNSGSPTDPSLFVCAPSANMSPYQNASAVHNIKQELPGSFTPLNCPGSFQDPQFESQVTGTFPWGQQTTNGSHIDPQVSSTNYGRVSGNSYISNHTGYQGMDVAQYGPINPQARFPQLPSGPNGEIMFGSQTQQMSQSGFPTPQPFGMTMEHPSSFQNPPLQTQYMVQGNPSNSNPRQLPMNGSLPVHLDPSGGLPFTQAPENTPHYHVQQQQQQQQQFYY
ncbi:hypothetical protein MMC30_008660 [Trapelia coarctata]|nr:hypothetical protein [Trapelia coarctata]